MPSTDFALLAVLAAELLLLQRGQRRLFWRLGGGGRLRPLVYLVVMPGTILHEGSHVLACYALGVPVGRARFFRPRRSPDGSVVLGSVSHGRTGPLRGALISVAPLVLVPAALAGVSVILLSPDVIAHLPDRLSSVAPWRLALWAWCSLSCAQAAFPSSGDHIGLLGALLVGAVVAVVLVVLSAAGVTGAALAGAVALLAPPAGASALALVVLRPR